MALLELVRSIQSTKVTYYKVRIYHFRTTLSESTNLLQLYLSPRQSRISHSENTLAPSDILAISSSEIWIGATLPSGASRKMD